MVEVTEAYPWARFLPADDVRAFADELRVAEAADDSAGVWQVVSAWRHTAEVHADPALFAQLTTEASDCGRIEP